MMVMRHLLTMMAMTFALLGGGCAVTEDIQASLFDTRKVNLTENTYAAADMLAQQTRSFMTPMTPMKLTVLSEVTSPEEVTPFGQQVANQIGSRFVQLGYNVQAMPQPPGMLNMNTAPVPLATGGAPQPKQMLISLRVIQSPDQRVIAAYDYTLPMTREIREMSMTAAERKKRTEDPVGTFLGVAE
jgi:hypothetical protein